MPGANGDDHGGSLVRAPLQKLIADSVNYARSPGVSRVEADPQSEVLERQPEFQPFDRDIPNSLDWRIRPRLDGRPENLDNRDRIPLEFFPSRAGSLVDGSYGLQRSPCGRFV